MTTFIVTLSTDTDANPNLEAAVLRRLLPASGYRVDEVRVYQPIERETP